MRAPLDRKGDNQLLAAFQLEFRTSSALQQAEGYLGGGHIGLYLDELVRNGLLKIKAEHELLAGCRALEIEHVFGTKIAQKTIWPKHWVAEQIMDAIKQAWHNKKIMQSSLKNDKVFGIVGKSVEGLEIEMYVEFLMDGKIKLKTAYPYFEEFSNL